MKELTNGDSSLASSQKKDQHGENLAKLKRFFPTEGAAKAFHQLIAFTQQSEEWMNYVAEVFEQFILWDLAPLSFDLLLELLLFTTCDRRLPGEKSIIDLYLDLNQEMTGEEFVFLQQLKASRFSVFQAKASEEKGCSLFVDLFRGDEVQVEMDGVTVSPDEILMGRIIPLKAGDNSRWHPVIYLTSIEAGMVAELETVAKKWFWQYSVAHRGWATGEDFIRENSYRFWRWYLEHYAPAL